MGARGAKKRESWPAMIEVFAQSIRIVPVRKRTRPITTPFGVSGKSAGKIEFHVRAGVRSGDIRPKGLDSDLRLPQRCLQRFPRESKRIWFGIAISGKSALSTVPRLSNMFSSTIPESRTRYFDPLSTLVWYWSLSLASVSCLIVFELRATAVFAGTWLRRRWRFGLTARAATTGDSIAGRAGLRAAEGAVGGRRHSLVLDRGLRRSVARLRAGRSCSFCSVAAVAS